MDKIRYALSGRTALITGASSGIGAHLAEILAAAGANVVVAALPSELEGLRSVAASVERIGGKALPVAFDVTDEASIQHLYDAAEKEFGAINTIYANAGIGIRAAATELSASDFDKVMDVNLRGVFLTAREGARRLLRHGAAAAARGRFILVSSIGSFKPFPENVAYNVSKAAVAMMAKTLALEWAEAGICVNAICPGSILTAINREFWESAVGQKRLAEHNPRHRLMDRSDLDDVMLMLGSDGSRAITGAAITVDDGQSLAY